MKTYTNQANLEHLIHQAQTHALLEPTRQTQSKYLRRAYKAAKYAIRTAWAALTQTLEPQGAL
jgi:hypothetical protein